MEQQKPLAQNIILNISKTLTVTLFPIITYMYISRIFGTEGYGKINFANSVVSYFLLFAMLGINSYATREAAKRRDSKEDLSKFVQEIMFINITSMLLAYIMLAIVTKCFLKIHIYKDFIFVYSLTIVLKVIGMEWLYLAMEDYAYVTIRTMLVQFFALIGVFLFVHTKEDLMVYSLIQVFSIGGNNIFNFFHSRKYVRYTKAKISGLVSHLKPVFSLFFMTLFINVFTHLDSTMLGIIQGDSAVGLYSAGDKMSSMICGLIGAISAVMLPRVAYYRQIGKIKEIKEIIDKTVNIILMLSVPSTIGVIFLGKPIILLFSGSAYYDAINTIRILSFRILLSPINGLFVLYIFIPLGHEKKSLFVTGTAAVLNFIVNIILIPIFAQNGAAFSTVLAEAVELILNLIFVNSFFPLRILLNSVWQYAVSSLAVILCWGVVSCVIFNIYLRMFLVVAVSIPIYFGILVLVKNKYVFICLQRLKLLRNTRS